MQEPTIHDLYECRYEPDKLVILIERMHKKSLKAAVLAQQTTNSVRDAIWVVRAIATRCGYMEDSEFLRCLDALPKQHP